MFYVLCFYSDLNKQIHTFIILLYFIQVSFVFFVFAKGLYVFTFALQRPVSIANILFYFISFYMQKAVCASFANNMNICSAKKQ